MFTDQVREPGSPVYAPHYAIIIYFVNHCVCMHAFYVCCMCIFMYVQNIKFILYNMGKVCIRHAFVFYYVAEWHPLLRVELISINYFIIIIIKIIIMRVTCSR